MEVGDGNCAVVKFRGIDRPLNRMRPIFGLFPYLVPCFLDEDILASICNVTSRLSFVGSTAQILNPKFKVKTI